MEAEVTKIKDRQEVDTKEMEVKDDMLQEMRNLNEELRANIGTKTDEIKLLIDRMENYKRIKESEIQKLLAKQRQTE